jgi:hypothetical protein
MNHARYQVRLMTQRLMANLMFDLPLTPAQRDDFGVETDDHYRALKAVLFNDKEDSEEATEAEIQLELEKRLVELDRACGNGPALTALVKKYAPEFAGITFKTFYDVLRQLAAKSDQQEC